MPDNTLNDKVSFSDLSKKILKFINEKNININEINSDQIEELAERPDEIFIKPAKEFYQKKIVYNYSDSLIKYLRVYK